MAGRCTSATSVSTRRITTSSTSPTYARPSRSTGGKTFITIDEGLGFGNQTVDQHAYWINPANPNHIMRGSDAGFAVSWDQGATWEYIRTMATGLPYWVTADMHRPYNVYSGMQDNDGWGGPSATRSRIGIRDHNWFRVSFENSGDGFQTAVDPTDRHTVYSEAQDGRTVRTDLRTGRTVSIRPVAPPATETPAAQPRVPASTEGSSLPPPEVAPVVVVVAAAVEAAAVERPGIVVCLCRRRLSLELEHTDLLSPQPEHHLDGREPAVPFRQPG